MKNTVLVIGAGCAGMVAALQAHSSGAETVIIDRGAIGLGTNSSLSAGRFSAPKTGYHPDDFIENTLETGRGINYKELVRVMAQEAPHAFSLLISLGLDLKETSRGYAVKPSEPSIIPGITLVRHLAEKVRNSAGIKIVTNFYVTDILKHGGRISGIRGFDRKGDQIDLHSSAVVLAAGGAGAIYTRNDNQKSTMGQGYYLAAKAGLSLWDMEFVQFYPLVIAEPGLPSLILYPPRPRETRLINAAGEDILERHGIDTLERAAIRQRDELSAILYNHALKEPVYIDYHKVPAAFWKNHPLARIVADFTKKPLAISPAAHFFMGGVRIDENAQTSLPGLFACGEVAWGIHGANRMGGNALTECAVLGSIAGGNAARYALKNPLPEQELKGVVPRRPSGHRPPAQGTLRELKCLIKQTAWEHAGVVRSEKGLNRGLAAITELEQMVSEVSPQQMRERIIREDLMSATFVLKAVLTASIARRESRGSFIREGFSQPDDLIWQKNSSLTYNREKGEFILAHCAVD